MRKLCFALMLIGSLCCFGQSSWTHVQGTSAASSSNVTSLTLTLPNNPGTGHDVIVGIQFGNGSSVPVSAVSVGDSNPNWYLQSPNSPFRSPDSSNPSSIYLFYLLNAPSNATRTITIGWPNATNAVAWADEFSSSSGAAAFDTDTGATGAFPDVTINTPGITPAGSHELLYALALPGTNITAPAAGATTGTWTGASGGIDSVVTGGTAEYDLDAGVTTTPNFTDSIAGDEAIVATLAIAPQSSSPTSAPTVCGNLSQIDTDDGNALGQLGVPCVTGWNAGGYTVSTIAYWVGSPTSTSFDLGVYADSSSSPGALLCHASTGTITPSSGWNSVNITGCPTLSPGTRYWIGYITGSNQIQQGITPGACPGGSLSNFWASGSQSSAALSSPFGPSVSGSACYSIYMALNPVAISNACGETAQRRLDSGNSNYAQATPCVTGSNAGGYTVSGISYWVGSPSASAAFDLGVYSDSSGNPGSLLCHASTGTIIPLVGWNSISVSGCPTLSANTPYWVGYINGSDEIIQGYLEGTCPGTSEVTVASDSRLSGPSLPNPFGANFLTSCYSMYLSLSTGSLSTPTLSVSSSLSPTSYGQVVSLTATISAGPTGLVSFYSDSVQIGQAPINGTTATLVTTGLPLGSHSITASWPGNASYNPVSSSAITQTVNVGTPVITWPNPAPLPYGSPLGAAQLNATANTAGTFAYSPAAGTVLPPGAQTLSVTFTPTDTADYTTATATVTLSVPILPSAGIITTIVGSGFYGYAGDGGQAINAEMEAPESIAVDSAGNIYIPDSDVGVVRKVIASTGVIATIAGTGTQGYSGDGGPATSAQLNNPMAVAVDAAGNVYISDQNNNRIRKVDASTGVITTVAGTGTADYSGDNGAATSAALSSPEGIAFDGAGNLYIADTENSVIRKLTVSTGIITTVAGNHSWGDSGDGGPATSAAFFEPTGVAVDSAGNLYISDGGDSIVREVAASTGTISTVAGNRSIGYSGDGGPATSAQLQCPFSIAVDAAGDLYIADYSNSRIRFVTSATGIITTVAGTGVAGYSGDGGPATSAELNIPHGVATDTAGNFYIADSGNHVVRVVGGGSQAQISVSVSPSSATLSAQQTKQFVATVTNTANTAVTWSLSPSGVGTISASGLYTAPSTISTQQTVTVIATSQANTSISASSMITLIPTIAVSVSPASVSLYGGQNQAFSATVTGSSNAAVTWSISPSNAGTIDSSGNYTAPGTIASQQTVTVTATSQADTTKSKSATVNLLPPCAALGYGYVRPIVIDHTKVPNTDQANFPFLFNTTDANLKSVAFGGHVSNAQGFDIVFSSDLQGQSKLNYEIEEYDPTAGRLIAWVQIPNLSHSTDTALYLLYGNSNITASQQNPNAVWDNTYKAVWHLPNGTQLSLADSTTNGNSATNNGAAATAGQIDGGMLVDGTSYATVGTPTSLVNILQGDATFSAWVNPVPGGGGSVMGNLGSSGWWLYASEGGFFFEGDYNDSYFGVGASGPNAGAWSYVTATLQNTPEGTVGTAYINGVPSGTVSMITGGAPDDSSQTIYLANTGYGEPFNGSLDELRISNVSRSPDWIATEYNNQGSPATFYSLYSENFQGVAPSITSLYASQSRQFELIGYCGSPAVSWSLADGAPGAITSSGIYTAPSEIDTTKTITVTANNSLNGSVAGSAIVTLLPPVQVTISPASSTIYMTNRSQQFTATVLNATNPAVTWSVSPDSGGTVDQTGLYTSPTYFAAQTVTITATSQLDPTKSASATVNLVPIVLTPTDINIYGGYADPITANVPVSWSVSPTTFGAIDSNGVFATSPNVTGIQQVTVTGTLQGDPTSFGSTVINIYSPGSITPESASVYGGQTQTIQACVPYDSVQMACSPGYSTWTVSPANVGAITASGVYYAPVAISSPQTVVVTATANDNPLIYFSSTLSLLPPAVAVSPATISLDAGQSEQFNATITNSSNRAVTWSISPANVGTISSSGLYQAPATISAQQNVIVTATSQAVPGIASTAVITLTPNQCAATAYSYVRPIVIDHTKVPNTDQINFPFLFSIIDPALASVANGGHVESSDGYDIIFSSDQAGKNLLDYELEKYDPVAGQIIAWIRVPTVSHLGDTALYMFYGNSGITSAQQNPPGVWNSGYVGVWHLGNGTVLSPTDSTTNAYNGTNQGASAGAGMFSGGASFAGTVADNQGNSSYIDIGNLGSFTTQGTIEFWMNPSSFPQYQDDTFSTYYGGGNDALRFDVSPTGNFAGIVGSTGYSMSNGPLQVNTWYDVALTWDAAISNATGFLNGVQAFDNDTATSWPTEFPDVAIGGGYTSGYDWNGNVDEVRISSVKRSSDWIAAEYNNEQNTSTFFSLYAENTTAVVPSAVSLYASQAQQFMPPNLEGCSAAPVIWSMPSGSAGTLSHDGFYTAPSVVDSQRVIPVTATTVGSQSQSFTANVTLLPPIALSVAPLSATLAPAQTQQFSANVTNTNNTNVQWQITPASVGAISSTGLYTAPATINFETTVTVTATSLADASQSSSATVTLVPAIVSPVTISVSPSTVTLNEAGTQQFTATVVNASNTSVNWTMSPAGVGTVDATGLYTAPSSLPAQQTVVLTATSVADPTKLASATITLAPAQCPTSGYGFERSIIIDHTKVANSDQVNFPFLFNVTDPTLATVANGGHVANSNGYDIVFSLDPNGHTTLDSEIEEYNPATGQIAAWIRIPTLSHTADTIVYVFYGNSNVNASQQNATGVWGTNFAGVWHFPNPTSLSVTDSSVNANNGIVEGGVSAAPGIIGGSASLDGSTGYIATTNYISGPSTYSLSLWFNTTTTSGGKLTGFGDNQLYGNDSYDRHIYMTNAGQIAFGNWNGSADALTSTASYNDGHWHHAVGTLSSTGQSLYVDGQLIASDQNTTASAYSGYWRMGFDNLLFWPNQPSSNYFQGNLDEVRVSNIAEPPDWITTEYNNQNSPSTFSSLSSENAEGVVPGAVTLYGSQTQLFAATGACTTDVAWSMPEGSPGALSSSGLYSAPASISAEQTVTITATPMSGPNSPASATITLLPPVVVTMTPASVALTASQNQQFTAAVTNAPNSGVNWVVVPAGAGVIDANGFYTAPATITTAQTVTVMAISQADPSKSASALVTLNSTVCASNGYGYQSTIVIDHTKIPNSDQLSFPFFFSATDPSMASVPNGGHVTSSNGYDIFFSADPSGQTKLDFELEQYNPATGAVTAWIRIPNLSHNTDTILYMFYGNSSVTSSQENVAGVWDQHYQAVYHLDALQGTNVQDSTTNENNGTSSATGMGLGVFNEGATFNGTSSYFEIPPTDFPSYPNGTYQESGTTVGTSSPFGATFGLWFKTASPGGLLGQAPSLSCDVAVFGICIGMGPTLPGVNDPAGWNPMMYIDDDGNLEGGAVFSSGTYDDNAWHYGVVTYVPNGQNTLYVDGQPAGTAQNTSAAYSSAYSYFVGTTYTLLQPEGDWNWLYFNGNLDEVRISDIPRSGDWIQTEYNNQGSPSTFYRFYPYGLSSVAPASVSLYATQSEQFIATGVCPGAVTWSMPANAPGSLSSGGLYTAPDAVSEQQSVTITASNQSGGTPIGSAAVTLLPPPAGIVLSALGASPYVVGKSQTFTAVLKDQSGIPEQGVLVVFNVSGANSNIGSVTTDQTGMATYSYTGTQSGSDSLEVSAVVNGNPIAAQPLSVSWIVPAQSTVASATLEVQPSLGVGGLIGAFTDSTGSLIEPIAIGAFAREFVVPEGATQLQLGVDDAHFADNASTGFVVKVNGNSTTVPATAMPWNWTTGALNNNYQFGMKDGTSPIIAATGLSAGQVVTIAYQSGTVAPGLPLPALTDANGDQTLITGTTLAPGTFFPTMYTSTSAYPLNQPITLSTLVVDGSGAPVLNVPVTVTISGANPGQYEATTDSAGLATFSYIGTNPGNDSLQAEASPSGGSSLISNQASITWASYPTPPPAGSFSLHYFGVNVNLQGYYVVAQDASGNPVHDANAGFYVSGIDNFQTGAKTDTTGQVAFDYFHTNPGPYSVVAVDTVDRNILISNTISGTWNSPSNTTSGSGDSLNISVSGNTTVTLPNILQLTGTVTDNLGFTPTLAWTMLSGPAPITFSAPQQGATNITFQAPGNYVLQLSATDNVSSGSAQFPVTVLRNPNEGTGWIGSPLYGATVSGIVPITVASGVNLQNGTLSYYPANNSNSVTVLNSNTTGSGQIGALDTTTLPNGSYLIQLQSTQTNGDSEYDVTLVNVGGDYKPGRLTTNVTDLVVPATGLAINIERSYDSLNANAVGDFGYGWNLSTNVDLTVDPQGNVTFTLGGQRRTFYLSPQSLGSVFSFLFLPTYSPEPGLAGTLSDAGSACSDSLGFVEPDGSLWLCTDGTPYTPTQYLYTDPSGTKYTISASGNLQSIADKNGNGLAISAKGILSSTGLSVPFVRDASGRITQITDPQGNDYVYSYDASGNLASVTYPNTTTPSTYTYDTNHHYTGGTDARGNPLPTTIYYGASDTDPNGLSLNGRVHSGTDALGQTRTYTYDLVKNSMTVTFPPDGSGNVGSETSVDDAHGDMLSYTSPLGSTTTYTYDANRDRTSTTDPLGHTTTYTYDSNANTTSITYPKTATSNNTTSYTSYNQYSEPTSATDELGNVRTFSYDANFNPQSVSDSLGVVASFQFNANGQIQAGAIGYDMTVNPSMASQYAYDANGNLASSTDALGRTNSFTYDGLGHKLTSTPPIPGSNIGGPASTTTYQYDALGNLTQTSAPLGDVTSAQYDANGNRVSSTDARSNTTTFQYDALNRLVLTTFPDQTTAHKTYDFRNNVVNSTDQDGNVTHNTYDLAGKILSVTQGYGTPGASTTTYAYYADGRKKSETDPLGHTTTYTYDAAGRLITVSNVAGSTQYVFDDAGNQVSVTDPNNNQTQYQYDARKRLVKTTFPDSTTVTNTYDGPGNIVSSTDQAGNVVENTYDAANQLVSVTHLGSPNAPNNVGTFAYNSDGNQVGMTDENGHTTQIVFDVLSRLTSTTLPDGSLSESRQYDTAGNLTSLTHFNGVTTAYAYDTLNRLLSRTTPGEAAVSFTYTGTGQRATMTDGSGTTTYSYDSQDRLTSKATPQGTLSYTYDAAGNVTSMASSNPNGVSVSYTYNDVGRLSTVVDNRLPSGSSTTTYTYDPASNLATAAYPNGLQSTFTYDQLDRLTAVISPVSNYTYHLGPTGNRTSATEDTGRAMTWTYDGIYRLTNEAISSAPSGKNGNVSYGLDPIGNRTSEISSLSRIPSGSSSLNADDELSGETYDNNGNATLTGGNTFAYDSENHLTSMNSGAVQMLYDGDGNRVAKSVSGSTTHYLVNDLNPIGYPQVVEELSGSGTVERAYTYGLQRISQNQIINNVWTPSFYEYDGMGSVRQLTDTAGVVTDSYEYDAFGNKINSTGTTPNNYLYRGEQYDSDLAMYYLRARYYNPLTGRFLSVDSEAGQGQRRYEYAGADPVNGLDPSGNEAIIEFALLQFYPGRLLIHFPGFPRWCGFEMGDSLPGCGGSGGSGEGGTGAGPGAPGGPPPPPPPNPCQAPKTLSATEVDPYGSLFWIKRDWLLSSKSCKGGYVVQHIVADWPKANSPSGHWNYWEAWNIPKGSTETTFHITNGFDDKIAGAFGTKLQAEARFYEGLQLPSTFVQGSVRPAGVLPATLKNPNLPVANATPPVIKDFAP